MYWYDNILFCDFILKYVSKSIRENLKTEELSRKFREIMSSLGLDMNKADCALIVNCGHQFDPTWLAHIIDDQAEFPRMRSEYDIGGLRARCPKCNRPFNPLDIQLITESKL